MRVYDLARQRFGAIVFCLVATTLLLSASYAKNEGDFGAFGPEGKRLREQLWIVPSGEAGSVLRATVFRPPFDGHERQPLVVINHGTTSGPREAAAMPVYYWLSRWFVERGFVVILPERRGYGGTGGPTVDAIGTCLDPDHYASGQIAADDIQAVVSYMNRQSFVEPNQTIVVGASSGGFASLALASRNPTEVRAVVNFAGGRGARPSDLSKGLCGKGQLLSAVAAYGKTARVPTLWFYAENDNYFGPQLATEMAAVWRKAGGHVDLRISRPYGAEGHSLVDDQGGWQIWGPALQSFLTSTAGSNVMAAANY